MPDIPKSDETILRHLFKKFNNSWTLFQKHSKLQKRYSVQNLKTLKAKVDKAESLFRNPEKQKKVVLQYKELKKENFAFKNRDDELRMLQDMLNDPELDKYTLRIFINERYPTNESKPDSSPAEKQPSAPQTESLGPPENDQPKQQTTPNQPQESKTPSFPSLQLAG